MTRWVAITWETDRLLFLSANVFGKSISFDIADTLDDPKKFADFAAKHHLAKAETVVILNRSDVEVRSMVFPPSPPDDVPEMVKFQAGREFTHYEPASPLDFFVTSKLENVSRSTLFPALKSAETVPTGAPKHLLASTLRLHTFQKIKDFCSEQNLNLRHVVLRPCAAAALWQHSGRTEINRSALLVELDKLETSQTVVFQGEPVFMRSPKIHRPQDISNPDFAACLLAELKRTRIAVRNEIEGINVDEVVLFGSGRPFESLAGQLAAGLDMPVHLFDPQKGLTVKTESADEKFAALFGAIVQAVRKEPMQIDFCNPKKRKENRGKRTLITGIAAAVLLFVTGLFGYAFYQRLVLQSEVRELSKQSAELEQKAGGIAAQQKQLDAVETWLADKIDWFEQLDWLSTHALPAQDMMITDFVISAANGGSMKFTALLRDSSVLAAAEMKLRDESHKLEVKNMRELADIRGNTRYRFQCNMTISLQKPSPHTVLLPKDKPAQ
ncbi:MAG: hypothetical protein LBH00_01885 [Planctomycetaceae bacterium]|jgi:hypothetical protein|nr:hypothetical protein [Planctomycetaceae bacterium]